MSTLSKILLGLLLGVTLDCGATSAPTRTSLHYVVTRDDHPVGRYDFLIVDQPDRREVTVQMNIKIKLLFLTIYQASHERRDIWISGRLTRSTGQSTYNGKTYDFDLTERDDDYLLQLNDTSTSLSGPVMTFAPWWPEVTGAVTLLTEKGRPKSVLVEEMDNEKLMLAGEETNTRKVMLRGQRDQELWYDSHGTLQRVRYTSRGSVIQIQLTSDARH